MAKEKGTVVATSREWAPTTDASLPHIQGTIDSWDRPGERASAAPLRDYAAIEAAVDRITKRVKTRKVTVTETVTEYVHVETPVATETELVQGGGSPNEVAELATVAKPAEGTEPKKLGFFARRRAAKEAKKAAETPVTAEPAKSFKPVAAAPARTVVADDAWDPPAPAGRPVSPVKPLQSKAAKRTAGKAPRKAAKKAGRKKR